MAQGGEGSGTPDKQAVEIGFRQLTAADLPAAQRLREAAGWNQTDRDWQVLLQLDAEGCFAALIDGEVVGTATAVRFEPREGHGSFGWVGMVLVDPNRRRLGIGSKLLHKTIDFLQGAGVETVRLDATPMGKTVYDQLGFLDEYEIERWEGTAAPYVEPPAGDWSIEPYGQDDGPVDEYDREVFGASRLGVLRAWREGWPEMAHVAERDGAVAGYALGRRGSNFHQIGPVIADAPEIAEALLIHALARTEGQPVVVDFVTSNAWARPIMERSGLKKQRPLIRMARGPNRRPGNRRKTLAICCPELG